MRILILILSYTFLQKAVILRFFKFYIWLFEFYQILILHCYFVSTSKIFQSNKQHFETLHRINFKPILLWKIPDVAISKQHTVKRKMKGINWLYLFWVRKKFSSWMTLAITTYLLMVTGHLYPNVVMDAKKQMFIFGDNER